jgi:hypothetical protein
MLGRLYSMPVLIVLLLLTSCSTATPPRKDDRIWQVPAGATPPNEKKNVLPNKPPDPTTVRVTMRADVRLAPSRVRDSPLTLPECSAG